MNEMHSKTEDPNELESTEMELAETENVVLETSSMTAFSSVKGNTQTVANIDLAISAVEQESINRSKPWRQIIKRRVVDGGNYYEG